MMRSLQKKYLSEICKVNYGKSPKDVLSEEGEFPVVGTGGIEKYADEYLYDGESIVLGRKGTIDKPTYIKDKFWVIDTAFYLSDFLDVNVKFLHYSFLLKNLKVLNESTGVPSVSRDNLYRLEFLIPSSKSEQTRIAEILSTADAAIAQTEALIAKYQRIKTGLMQDLLTRGIDAHGNIRRKATHKFVVKNGIEVPEEWEVVRFEECYKNPIRDFGSFSSTKLIDFLEEGIPFIKSEMIEIGRIKWDKVTYISTEVHELLSKSHVKKGNILFSKIGSALGKAVVYENEFVSNSNAAIAKIDLDPQKADNYFICYFLNYDFAQYQFQNMIVSLLPRINLGDINNLIVMLPSIEEQKKIAKILQSIDENIAKQNDHLSKLYSLKTSLMQDLLSGRVRVKVKD